MAGTGRSPVVWSVSAPELIRYGSSGAAFVSTVNFSFERPAPPGRRKPDRRSNAPVIVVSIDFDAGERSAGDARLRRRAARIVVPVARKAALAFRGGGGAYVAEDAGWYEDAQAPPLAFWKCHLTVVETKDCFDRRVQAQWRARPSPRTA